MPTTSPTSLNTPYVVLTGVVLISVVFLFVVLRPMMDEVNSLRQTIAEDQEALKHKQTFLNSLDSKIRQLATLADVEKQMLTVLPENERMQDVIRILHEYANQSGITINIVTNNSTSSEAEANAAQARGDALNLPNALRTLQFEVNIIGSYEQVRTFTKLIENSPRIVDIRNVKMTQVSNQPGQANATLVMNLYSQQSSH
jgi:Tfp pilus assembly protein PilO